MHQTNTPIQPRKEHRLTVVLSPAQYEALNTLCHLHHETKIGTIRNLIEAAYRMDVGGQPFCATGAGCLCAMLHAKPTHAPSAGTGPHSLAGGAALGAGNHGR